MNPLISVIVPVYNVEAYLDRCVDSLVNQTYENLEIILVDDGSTDRSGVMCDEWAKRDARVAVIHKKNGGQGDARNKGIESAKGAYIGFVDSDDLISTRMYKGMSTIAVEKDADVVGCRRFIFEETQQPVFDHVNSTQVLNMTQEEAIEDIMREEHFRPTVWNLLVRASIAKQVKFDVGKIHEDILWPFRVLLNSTKIYFTENCYYAYFQRSGSTMNSRYSAKRFDELDALETRAAITQKTYPALYHMAVRAYLGGCMNHYQFLCREKKEPEYQNYKKLLHKRFCAGDQTALFDGLSLDYMLWYSLFKVCPDLTSKVRNLLKLGC